MKINCKQMLTGGGKIAYRNLLTALFSLVLVSSATLTSCNSLDEDIPVNNNRFLSISVGLNSQQSRAIINGNTLPNDSQIGVMLDDGTAPDYDVYNNVCYTASEVEGIQKWTPSSNILLSTTAGTVYAYYPYKEGTDLSALTIDTESQIDYLYATPVPGISEKKSTASISMNHAMSKIKLTFIKGTYSGGDGNFTSLTIRGNGMATGGMFNAAQQIPDYVEDSFIGTNETIPSPTNPSLNGSAVEWLVVPNGIKSSITISAKIDNEIYSVKTPEITLEKGNSYEYVLVLNSTFMEMTSVSVKEWDSQTNNEDIILDKEPISIRGIKVVYTTYSDNQSVKLVKSIDSVDKIMVDGVEITPVTKYTFPTKGDHIVYIRFSDETKIPDNAFEDCENISNVFVTDFVKSIGNQAFDGCWRMNEITLGKEVETMGYDLFAGCSQLALIRADMLEAPIVTDSRWFSSVKDGGTLYVPQGSLDSYQHWFELQFGLDSKYWAIIENGLVAENGIYYSSDGLKVVDVDDNWNGEFVVKEGISIIGRRAFQNCTALNQIVIPNSVTTIGYEAFSGCMGLTKITIPAAVVKLERRVFAGCSNLYNITLLPDVAPAVDSWGESDLYGNIFIPAGGTENYSSWSSAYSNCKIIEQGSYYKEDGIIYSSDSKTIISTDGTLTGNVVVDEGVENINNKAFMLCKKITAISIPTTMKNIGDKAFYGCSGLKGTLVLPNSVQSIGDSAFNGCEGLTALELGTGVQAIGENAFSGCRKLNGELILPDNLTNIGEYAFGNCEDLDKLVVGNKLLTISKNAFFGCTHLSNVVISNSVVSIEEKAFYCCRYMNELTIGSNVQTIGSEAFSGGNYTLTLKKITSHAQSAPAIVESSFRNISDNGTLIVPKGSDYSTWMSTTFTKINWILQEMAE